MGKPKTDPNKPLPPKATEDLRFTFTPYTPGQRTSAPAQRPTARPVDPRQQRTINLLNELNWQGGKPAHLPPAQPEPRPANVPAHYVQAWSGGAWLDPKVAEQVKTPADKTPNRYLPRLPKWLNFETADVQVLNNGQLYIKPDAQSKEALAKFKELQAKNGGNGAGFGVKPLMDNVITTLGYTPAPSAASGLPADHLPDLDEAGGFTFNPGELGKDWSIAYETRNGKRYQRIRVNQIPYKPAPPMEPADQAALAQGQQFGLPPGDPNTTLRGFQAKYLGGGEYIENGEVKTGPSDLLSTITQGASRLANEAIKALPGIGAGMAAGAVIPVVGPILGGIIGGVAWGLGQNTLEIAQQAQTEARLKAGYDYAAAVKEWNESTAGKILNLMDAPRSFVERSAGVIDLTLNAIGDKRLANPTRNIETFAKAWDAAQYYYDAGNVNPYGVLRPLAWVGLLPEFFNNISIIDEPGQQFADTDMPRYEGGAAMLSRLIELTNAGATPEDLAAYVASTTGAPGVAREFISGFILDPLDKTNAVASRLVKGYAVTHSPLLLKAIELGERGDVTSAYRAARESLNGGATLDAAIKAGLAEWRRPGAGGEGLAESFKRYRNLLLTEKVLRPGAEALDDFTRLERLTLGDDFIRYATTGEYVKPKPWQFWKQNPKSTAISLINEADTFLQTRVMYEAQTPEQAIGLLRAFKSGDFSAIPNAGDDVLNARNTLVGRFVQRTLDVDGAEDLLGKWQANAPAREALGTLEKALGAADNLESARLVQRLAESEANAQQALDGYKAATGSDLRVDGRPIGAADLSALAKSFTTDKTNPRNAAHFKALLYTELMTDFGRKFVQTTGIKPPRLIFRMAAATKAVSSVLLLAPNPQYLVNNFTNGFLMMGLDGVLGLQKVSTILNRFDRLGIDPVRLRAGVGQADLGDLTEINADKAIKTARTLFEEGDARGYGEAGAAAAMGEIRKATQTEGVLSDIQQIASRISGSAFSVTKYAQELERFQSANAVYRGFMQMWNRTWREGAAIPKMPRELEAALAEIDPALPDAIRGVVRAGYNLGEITDKIFTTREISLTAEAYTRRVADALGLEEQAAADLLRDVGVLELVNEELGQLKKRPTPGDVRRIFEEQVTAKVEQHITDAQRREIAVYMDRVRDVYGSGDTGEVSRMVGNVLADMHEVMIDHLTRLDDEYEEIGSITQKALRDYKIEQSLARGDAQWRTFFDKQRAIFGALGEELKKSGVDDKGYFSTHVDTINTRWQAFFDHRRQALREFFDRPPEARTREAWLALADDLQARYDRVRVDATELQRRADAVFTAQFARAYGKDAGERFATLAKMQRDFLDEDRRLMSEFRARLRTVRSRKDRHTAWRRFHDGVIEADGTVSLVGRRQRWQAHEQAMTAYLAELNTDLPMRAGPTETARRATEATQRASRAAVVRGIDTTTPHGALLAEAVQAGFNQGKATGAERHALNSVNVGRAEGETYKTLADVPDADLRAALEASIARQDARAQGKKAEAAPAPTEPAAALPVYGARGLAGEAPIKRGVAGLEVRAAMERVQPTGTVAGVEGVPERLIELAERETWAGNPRADLTGTTPEATRATVADLAGDVARAAVAYADAVEALGADLPSATRPAPTVTGARPQPAARKRGVAGLEPRQPQATQPMTRADFERRVLGQFTGDTEQRAALLTAADFHARRWAETTGRSVDEWYGQWADRLSERTPTPAAGELYQLDPTSEAFKRWFGDSRVVDAEGQPLVVYHGTNSEEDFAVFKSRQTTSVYLIGNTEIESVDSWDMGSDYALRPEAYHYGAVTDVLTLGGDEAYRMRERELSKYLATSATARRHLADIQRLRDLEKASGERLVSTREVRPSGNAFYFTPDPGYSFIARTNKSYPVYLSIKNPIYLNAAEIEGAGYAWNAEKYKAMGYDGAIFADYPKDLIRTGWSGSTQIVAFYPEQIKSVFNRGTFDPADPNILYQRAAKPAALVDQYGLFGAEDGGAPTQFSLFDMGAGEAVARPLADLPKPSAGATVAGVDWAVGDQVVTPSGQIGTAVSVTGERTTVQVGGKQKTFSNTDLTFGARPLFQSDTAPAVGPVWYSVLARTLEQKMGKTMPADQLRKMLAGAGVKADELAWSGFDEWLSTQTGPVSKAEALAYLRENQITLKETTLGEQAFDYDAAIERIKQEYRDELDNYDAWEGNFWYDWINSQRQDMLDEINANRTEVEIDGETFYDLTWGNKTVRLEDGYDENWDVRDAFNLSDKKMYDALPQSDKDDAIENSIQDSMGDIYERADEMERAYNEAPDSDTSVYSKYTLPGGENYREVLLYANGVEGFVSPHFESPDNKNLLAHFRLDDRTDADGQRVLFIEEIQSDWHQAGREKGYRNIASESAIERRIEAIDAERKALISEMVGLRERQAEAITDQTGYGQYGWDWLKHEWPDQKLKARHDEIDGLLDALEDENQKLYLERERAQKGIPNAPWAKTWHEMAFRRILRLAAEEGYDRVAWTTGAQQAERYSNALQQSVDRLTWEKREGGAVEVTGYQRGAEKMRETLAADRVQAALGKELADAIAASDQTRGEFAGSAIKISDTGMAGFYDDILVKYADKVGKKWGTKAGETQIRAGKILPGETESMPSRPVDVVRTNMGWSLSFENSDVTWGAWSDRDSAVRRLALLRYEWDNTRDTTVHALDITPAMRESVLREGVALFQDTATAGREAVQIDARAKGMFKLLADGRRYVKAGTGADISTAIHEVFGHGFLYDLFDMAQTDTGSAADLKTVVDWANRAGLDVDYADFGFEARSADLPDGWRVAESGGRFEVRDERGTTLATDPDRDAAVRRGKEIAAHELFARGMERFMTDGYAPTPELRNVFARFRQWLVSVYRQIIGSPIGREVPADVRAVYERLFVQATPAAPLTDAPHRLTADQFVKGSDIDRALRAQYVRGAEVVADSTTTPSELIGVTGLRPGQWVIDDLARPGQYGTEIYQARLLDPETLMPVEDLVLTNIDGRGDDSARYQQWLSDGRQAPPIAVMETNDGRYTVIDGHRRYYAAKAAKFPVLALVQPRMEIGRSKDGAPLYVQLTREAAMLQAYKRGDVGAEAVRDIIDAVNAGAMYGLRHQFPDLFARVDVSDTNLDGATVRITGVEELATPIKIIDAKRVRVRLETGQEMTTPRSAIEAVAHTPEEVAQLRTPRAVVETTETAPLETERPAYAVEAAAVQPEPPTPDDRRLNLALRRSIDEMDAADRAEAIGILRDKLLVNPVSGAPSVTAYLVADKRAVQVHSDVDGLKWINDNFGHGAGDALLRAMSQALADEGIDYYHISGDEFYSQFDTTEAAQAAMERVRDRLGRATITWVNPDGSTQTFEGVRYSYGYGPDSTTAESALGADKARREASGDRSARGAKPTGLAERFEGQRPGPAGRTPGSDPAAEVDAVVAAVTGEPTPTPAPARELVVNAKATDVGEVVRREGETVWVKWSKSPTKEYKATDTRPATRADVAAVAAQQMGDARRRVVRGWLDEMAQPETAVSPRDTTADLPDTLKPYATKTTGGATHLASPIDPTVRYEAVWVVRELDSLVAHHDTAGAVNPAYPADWLTEAQSAPADLAMARTMAETLKPDLLLTGYGLGDGTPIVDGDGRVLSGNARTLALRLAAEQNPATYTAYRDAMRRAAGFWGISADEVADFRQPVLVRELTQDTDPAALARLANKPVTGESQAARQAVSDARFVPDAALVIPDGLTLAQTLRQPYMADFVSAFLDAMPEADKNWLLMDDGELSAAGVRRIGAALLAKAAGGDAGLRLAWLLNATDDVMTRNVLNGLMGSLPELRRSAQRTGALGIADDLSVALAHFADMESGPLTPLAEKMLVDLNDLGHSARRTRDVLAAYDRLSDAPAEGADGVLGRRADLWAQAMQAEAEPSVVVVETPSPQPSRIGDGASPRRVELAEARPGDVLPDGRVVVQRGLRLKREAQLLADESGGAVLRDGTRWAVAREPEQLMRHEMPPAVAEALTGWAQLALANLRDGTPGKRVRTESGDYIGQASTYPDFYQTLSAQYGAKKEAVESALNKIITDNGADTGLTVERLKTLALREIAAGFTDPLAGPVPGVPDAAVLIGKAADAAVPTVPAAASTAPDPTALRDRWNALDYGQRQDLANTVYGTRAVVHRIAGSTWDELGSDGERQSMAEAMRPSPQPSPIGEGAKAPTPEELTRGTRVQYTNRKGETLTGRVEYALDDTVSVQVEQIKEINVRGGRIPIGRVETWPREKLTVIEKSKIELDPAAIQAADAAAMADVPSPVIDEPPARFTPEPGVTVEVVPPDVATEPVALDDETPTLKAAPPETAPAADISGGSPDWAVGDRAVTADGQHGRVTAVVPMVSRSIRGGRYDVVDQYTLMDVLLDTGRTIQVNASRAGEVSRETGTAPTVARWPEFNGTILEPNDLESLIQSHLNREREYRRSAQLRRGRDAYKKADDLQKAERVAADAAQARAILEQWYKDHPEDALRYRKPADVVQAEAVVNPVSAKTGVRMQFNDQLNGVELIFDTRPSDATLAEVRAAGFKWSSREKMWYAKRSDRTIAAAKRIAGVMDEVKESASTAKVSFTDSDFLNPATFISASDGDADISANWSASRLFNVRNKLSDKVRDLRESGEMKNRQGLTGGDYDIAEASQLQERLKYVDLWLDLKSGRAASGEVNVTLPSETVGESSSTPEPIGRILDTEAEDVGVLRSPAGQPEAGPQEPAPQLGAGDAGDVVLSPARPGGADADGRDTGGDLEPARGAGQGRVPGPDRTRPAQPRAGAGDRETGLAAARPAERRERVTPEQPQAEPDALAAAQADLAQPLPSQTPTTFTSIKGGNNYRITAADALGSGGKKTKYRNNVAAIRLLKQLEAEGRLATPDEQAVLVKYTGWGGLKEVFDTKNAEATFEGYDTEANNGRGGYVKRKNDWHPEYLELKALLTPEEYDAANLSKLNAHYTSFDVVSAMWSLVQRLGFTGGRVLEPAGGSGNFIGLMPPEVFNASRTTAIEMDHLTGRLLGQLYQGVGVHVSPYQKVPLPNNYYDLIISNIPFGRLNIADRDFLNRPGFLRKRIHNYYFAKALDQARPGGLIAFITSAFTLDAPTSRPIREWLHQNGADFVGAIRLPQDAFEKNAGTSVLTDIIVLRKRAEGEPPTDLKWFDVKDFQAENGKTYAINEYFADHPEMMIGTPTDNEMYTPKGYYDQQKMDAEEQAADVLARFGLRLDNPDNLPRLLAEAGQRLPADVYQPVTHKLEREGAIIGASGRELYKTDGVYRTTDGRLATWDGKTLNDYAMPDDLDPTEVKDWQAREGRYPDYVAVRDAYDDLISRLRDGQTEEALDAARQTVDAAYDAFVARHGRFNDRTNRRLFADDPDLPILLSLEKVNETTGEISKEPILLKVTPQTPPDRADTALDALVISLQQRGKVDLNYMRALTGKPDAALLAELGDRMYRDPQAGWVTREEYLSGNVRTKLKTAEALAETDPAYARNIEALKAVVPEWMPYTRIFPQLGASWLEPGDVGDFIASLVGRTNVDTDDWVRFQQEANLWTLNLPEPVRIDPKMTTQWGTPDRSAEALLTNRLNSRPIRVEKEVEYTTESGHTARKRVLDEGATLAANQMADKLQAEFEAWLWKDETRRARYETKYNEIYHSWATRQYRGREIYPTGYLPGMNASLPPMRDAQLDAIWRGVQEPNLGLFHDVGAGKTRIMIAIGMEQRRMGLRHKVVYDVPNASYTDFVKQFKELYPTANLLTLSPRDIGDETRRATTMARMASGNYDAIVVPHSTLTMIPVTDKTFNAYIGERVAALQVVLDDLKARRDEEARANRNVYSRRKQKEEGSRATEQEIKRIAKLMDGYLQEARGLDEADAAQQAGEIADVMRQGGRRGGRKPKDNSEERKANRIAKLQQQQYQLQARQDTGLTWEDLGIDQLFVDEAHKFKNLSIESSRTDVRGMGKVNADDSQRAQDLYMKLREVNKRGGGVVFATGTPVSNSGVEMYTMMKYLHPERLRAMGIYHADAWLNQFAQIFSSLEPNATNTAYKDVARFRLFRNGRALLSLLREFADIQTADMLNLPRPKPKYVDVVVKMSPEQMKLREVLADRQKKLKRPRPGEKAEDTWFSIMADGRKMAVDMRLYDPRAKDRPESKINTVVKKVLDAYQRTTDYRGTQLIFLTEGVHTSPNLYQDIRKKLIAGGIKKEEIAFIQDYPLGGSTDKAVKKAEAKRQQLFDDVNEGKVRVVFGTYEGLGTGVNVQRRLFAVHEVTVPFKPSEIEQGEGRILRPGNLHYDTGQDVEIYRYSLENSNDAFMWNLVNVKAQQKAQVFSGKADLDTFDTPDAGSGFDNSLVNSFNDPLAIEWLDVSKKFMALDMARKEHGRRKVEYGFDLKSRQTFLEMAERSLSKAERLAAYAKQHRPEKFSGVVGGRTYGKVGEFGEAVYAAMTDPAASLKSFQTEQWYPVATVNGFEVYAKASPLLESSRREVAKQLQKSPGDYLEHIYYSLVMRGGGESHEAVYGRRVVAGFTGEGLSAEAIGRALNKNLTDEYTQIATTARAQIAEHREYIDTLESEVKKPFDGEEDYLKLLTRKAELDKYMEELQARTEAAAREAGGVEADDTGAADDGETLYQRAERPTVTMGGRTFEVDVTADADGAPRRRLAYRGTVLDGLPDGTPEDLRAYLEENAARYTAQAAQIDAALATGGDARVEKVKDSAALADGTPAQVVGQPADAGALTGEVVALPGGESAAVTGATDETLTVTRDDGRTLTTPIDPGVYPTPPQATADSRPVPLPDALSQLWTSKVRGMVDQMKDLMAADAGQPQPRGLGGREIPADTLALLDKYLGQVGGAMGKAKQQAMRWGEIKRDAALLNYSDRRVYNEYLSLIAPYEFFTTRSMAQWALRALDHPSLIANYLRTQRLLETAVTGTQTPTRLHGQARIPMPFLPDWMGDAIYFNPLRIGLPLQSFTDPWTNWGETQAKIADRATKTLMQWADDEQSGVSEADALAAIRDRQGAAWDKAVAYVKSQDTSLNQDALDFGMSILSPHLPLKWALDSLRGKQGQTSPLPITKYVRALSIAAGVGGSSGVNLEEGFRKANGLPVLDQWADYRIDREMANLAAEGALKPDGTPITVDEVKAAMISREGVVYEMAAIREAQQSMLKALPLGMALKAEKPEDMPAGVLSMALVTLFGQGVTVLPEGEQTQRDLATQYRLFKAAYDAEVNGGKSALTAFLADHPAYEARLALYDKPEERLSNFLVDKVWEKYQALPLTYKQDVQQAFGQEFQTAFLNKLTRDYDAIPPETLARWARTLGTLVPGQPATQPLPVQWTDPATTRAVETYYREREQLFDWPAVSAQLGEYYDLDPAEKVTYQSGVYRSGKKKGQPILKSVTRRSVYLDQHPDLGAYFDWSSAFKKANPGVQAYIDEGKVLRGDTDSPYTDSQWAEMGYTLPQELTSIAQAWIFSGRKPNATAMRELTKVWEANGKPYGDVQKWTMMELAY